MKRNVLLIPFIAALTLMTVGLVSANLATSINTEFNGVVLGNGTSTMTGTVNNIVPVRVTFTADNDASDVKVKVYMEGYRNEISVSTNRFDIESGKTYTKLLSLRLPSDSKNLSEDYTLYVDVVSKSDRTEQTYPISLQRASYTLKVLSVDYSSKVSAGDVFPVSVVIKNSGYNRLDDAYVIVSIPALGISARGYVGDLISTEDYKKSDNEKDSISKTVYLKIPENANSGTYDLKVETYNNDADTIVSKLIDVGDSASTTVLATVKNKDLNAGETTTYDLVIVNSANDVKVFRLNAVSGNALDVSVPSVITVGPDASKTIPVTVKAKNDVAIGTYTFSVAVNDEQVVFGANVVSSSVSTSAVALTVVLVIILAALLAVLIVLLTRKKKPSEEVETSYY